MGKNKNIFGVILAGGSGSRLWPLSREMFPKQLLRLTGKNTLFQSTFLRLTGIIPEKNIITVTNNLHLTDIKIQTEEIIHNESYSVIGEPVGRNTAPAVGLAALFIKNRLAGDSDPILFVTPSDQLIQDNEAFLDAVRDGVGLAEEGYIVTFGIKPSRPETGYGYIKINKELRLPRQPLRLTRNDSCLVEEFKEKPDPETAKKYLKAGNYFWNSGIFMFKLSTILQEMQIHSPDVLEGLNKLDLTKDYIEKEDYQAIPSISIDYAVMEKSGKIVLIPVDCGWNDLGSWEAIYDVSKKDSDNNCLKGNVTAVDTKNSYIYGQSRFVSAIGMENTVIIETGDAVLVCDKSKTQDVKTVFETLKKENSQLYYKHTLVNELWGSCKTIQQSTENETRELTIKSGHKMSFPEADKRKRHLYITSGQAKLFKPDGEKLLKAFDSADISPDSGIYIENTGKSELKIIEIITV